MEGKSKIVVESSEKLAVNGSEIRHMIYVIRGKQVMIDSDLAMLYQVETKNLNKAMRRNEKRFPEEFCFQLTKEETDCLRFQTGTSKEESRGGRRYMPYVYTEQGIAMLSAVLRSDVAIQVSIRIMKTFVEMRKYLSNTSIIYERVNAIEMQQISYQEQTDKKLEQIFDYISDHEEENQKIFYEGQIFDAFSLLADLIQQAEKTIVLIDGYVDVATLNLLAKKKDGVEVTLYTLPSAKLSEQDIKNFNAQYPKVEIKRTAAFHDRFLLLDGKVGYHIGASIKDAGKKCFGINRMEDIGVINDLLQRAELTS